MNNNFIIFSSINWSTHWQIHHQLVNSIRDSGGKVLFVENTGVRSPKVKDFKRIIDRIRSRMRSVHGFKGEMKGLTIYTPLFIPYPYSRLAIFFNIFFISRAINKWNRVVNFYRPVCLSFLPTPTVQKVIKEIDSSLVVYYCADDMSRPLENPNKLIKYENRFFKESDVVFTTSHKIYDKASQFSDFVYNIPAGVDLIKFLSQESPSIPEDIEHIAHPIIGYVGAISDVFDQELILQLAVSLPDVTIILVGPKYTDTSILENVKNIIFIGERSHDFMPNYINSFDITLIPYIVNHTTNSVYPCKLNEYLSLGKPVLSTNLHEIEIFNNNNNNLVSVGVNAKDFILEARKIIESLPEETEENRIKRINVARGNTWDKRFLEMSSIMSTRIKLKSKQTTKNWRKELINSYKKSKYSLIRKIIITSVLYLLIFNSPIFWFLGEQLIVRDEPKKVDAIVVFSGDGHSDYQNLTYQKRALDAIKYYKDGYANKIFLSSGREQTISDVELIKLYLTNRGVPLTFIHILEKYPKSTYQNVRMVKKSLDINNVDSALFITAPYHSKRALLTWEKNAPNIDIVVVDTTDPSFSNVQWGVDFDRMKVIMYEYIAIAHNWLLGRI